MIYQTVRLTPGADFTIERWMLDKLVLIDSGGVSITASLPDINTTDGIAMVGNIGTGVVTVGGSALKQGECALFVMSNAGMWIRLQEIAPALKASGGNWFTLSVSGVGAVTGVDTGSSTPPVSAGAASVD